MKITSSKLLWTGLFFVAILPSVTLFSFPQSALVGFVIYTIGLIMHWMDR